MELQKILNNTGSGTQKFIKKTFSYTKIEIEIKNTWTKTRLGINLGRANARPTGFEIWARWLDFLYISFSSSCFFTWRTAFDLDTRFDQLISNGNDIIHRESLMDVSIDFEVTNFDRSVGFPTRRQLAINVWPAKLFPSFWIRRWKEINEVQRAPWIGKNEKERLVLAQKERKKERFWGLGDCKSANGRLGPFWTFTRATAAVKRGLETRVSDSYRKCW